MSNTDPNQKELKRIHRLLRQMAETVEHASLTGSLQQGGGQAIQQYNSIVARLEQIGEIPAGFFPPLTPDIPFDGIGIAAGNLAAYIEDAIEEENPQSNGGSDREHRVDSPSFSVNIGGPVTLGDLESLRSLGDILRNNMPDWIKDKLPGKEGEEKTVDVTAEPTGATASPAPAPPAPPAPPTVNRLTAISDAPHVAEFVPDSPVRERVS